MSRKFQLVVKRQVYVPTVLGWVLLLSIVAGTFALSVTRTYPFLACSKPNAADAFIIEGWVPDYILEERLTPLAAGSCRLVITTGPPIGFGQNLSQYKTYAELTAARLIHTQVD